MVFYRCGGMVFLRRRKRLGCSWNFFRDHDEDAESLWVLAAEASAAIGPHYTQEAFDRGPDLDALLNLRFDCGREDVMDVMTRMFTRRRDMRWKLLAMNGARKLPREIPSIIRETVRPLLLRMLPRLRPAVFAALRPPLPDQYALWTGPSVTPESVQCPPHPDGVLAIQGQSNVIVLLDFLSLVQFA